MSRPEEAKWEGHWRVHEMLEGSGMRPAGVMDSRVVYVSGRSQAPGSENTRMEDRCSVA